MHHTLHDHAPENALPHYCGSRTPNCDYHHGSLPPVKGVRCY